MTVRRTCRIHGPSDHTEPLPNKAGFYACLRCLAERVRDCRDKGLVFTPEFKARLRAYLP